MDEHELLIQRFLDHDLTPAERVRFLQTIDAEPALRRQWLNLEMVVAEAGQLPKIVPSARFFSELKHKLAPRSRHSWERLWATVMAPRTLEWNLAGAVAAVCVVIVSVAGLFAVMPPRVLEVPVPTTSTHTMAARTEQKEPKVFVRLILLQPEAHSVSVAGDFNGWNPAQTPLERSDGGVWTATIPLPPGRYQYMFVIDGKEWIADPLAAEETTDGFGAHNAVLDVAI